MDLKHLMQRITITRETLELAAYAMQREGVPRFMNYTARDDGVVLDLGCRRGAVTSHWRPHVDLAAAAWLADHTRMYVDSRGTAVQARLFPDDMWTRVERDGNPHAWCEAVVLCLAAHGRRMREEQPQA